MNSDSQSSCGESPNDPKLSDTERRHDACAAGLRGAGGVTERRVRCSAWLGFIGLVFRQSIDLICRQNRSETKSQSAWHTQEIIPNTFRGSKSLTQEESSKMEPRSNYEKLEDWTYEYDTFGRKVVRQLIYLPRWVGEIISPPKYEIQRWRRLKTGLAPEFLHWGRRSAEESGMSNSPYVGCDTPSQPLVSVSFYLSLKEDVRNEA